MGGNIDQFCPRVGEKMKKPLSAAGVVCHYVSEVTGSGHLLYLAEDRAGGRCSGEQMLKLGAYCVKHELPLKCWHFVDVLVRSM